MSSRDLLTRYTRTKSPDKEALAELVIKAKGPRRSMRQFADDLGVNVSTLSRIVNKKTQRANSDNLIADIADHADPDSHVTFEQLMEAHGMELKNQPVRNHHIALMETFSETIINELSIRNYTVHSNMMESRATTLDSIMGRCYLDFELHTNALGKDDSVWLFDFYFPNKGGIKDDEQQLNRIRQWMLMYAGMLCFNESKVDRLSVVISSKYIYDRLLEHLEGYTTRYGMSVILVDLEAGKVIEEYVLCDDPHGSPVFFPLPEELPVEDEPEDLGGDFPFDEELFRNLLNIDQN